MSAAAEKARSASPPPSTSIYDLSVFLNDNCNLRCDYCFLHGKPSKLTHSTREVQRQGIDWLLSKTHKTPHYHFFGTEPLLSWDLLADTVEYGRKRAAELGKKLTLGVTSNTTLFTQSRAAFLKEKDVSVLVSFDGTQESHDAHRKYAGGQGSWREAVEGIRLLAEAGVSKTCALQVVPDQVHRLLLNIKAAFRQGFQTVALNKIVDSYNAYTAQQLDTIREQFYMIDEYIVERWRQGDFIEVPFLTKTALETGTREDRSRWTCGACHGSLGMWIDGSVYPCHRLSHWPELSLGTLEKLNEAKIEWWRGLNSPQCKSCRYHCYPCAICYATNLETTGHLLKNPPANCLYEKTKYRAGLYLRARLREEGLLEKFREHQQKRKERRKRGHSN